MARLPIPGSDDGDWGEILNDFLSVEHAADGSLKSTGSLSEKMSTSLVAAKGDLIVGTASETPVRLPVGGDGDILTSSSASATGMIWAPSPPAPSQSIYPLSAYGFVAASGNIEAFDAISTLGSNMTRVFVPAGAAISVVGALLNTAAVMSGSGENSFAIYDDAGMFVAQTVSDDTLWTNEGWILKTLPSVVPAQSVDRFVNVGIAVNSASSPPYAMYATVGPTPPPALGGAFRGGYNRPNHRRAFYFGSMPSWPASLDLTTVGNDYGYLPLIVLA
ncbi:MAG: hypothetical protein HZB75_01620 [Candidatus Saccharibacteria bacterium]|nr:MAG: hypothetical protein HZB75_01620 [Candidatus Saccharibacteria bacterium]